MNKVLAIGTIILAMALVIVALFIGCSDEKAKPIVPPNDTVQEQPQDELPDQQASDTSQSKLAEGIIIMGVDVGAMQSAQALEKLQAAQAQTLAQYTLDLTYNDRIFSYGAEQLRLTMDLQAALTQAQSAQAGQTIDVPVVIDDQALSSILAEVSKQIGGKPVEPTAKFNQQVSGNFEFTEGEAGYAVDTQLLTDQIRQAINQQDLTIELTIPVTKTAPKHTLDQIKQNVSRISLFTTSYKDNAGKDRTENLKIGMQKLNGATIQPGETFSFNKHVGPRDEASGFKKAATIVAGSIFEDDWGGGICQVSTTLYNAILLADLKIEERYKHSIPSSYVPYGQDAAVVYGAKDFRFTNNTDFPIYIVASIDNNEKKLAIGVYGAELPDDKSIKIKSVTKEEIPPAEPETIEDETTPAGKKNTIKKARNGYVVEIYKQVYQNGEMQSESKLYTDNYRPVQGVVSIGTMGETQKKQPEPKEEASSQSKPEETPEEEIYIPEE